MKKKVRKKKRNYVKKKKGNPDEGWVKIYRVVIGLISPSLA